MRTPSAPTAGTFIVTAAPPGGKGIGGITGAGGGATGFGAITTGLGAGAQAATTIVKPATSRPRPIFFIVQYTPANPFEPFRLSTRLMAKNKACIAELRKEKGPVVNHRALFVFNFD
jgi:hypothetical protein